MRQPQRGAGFRPAAVTAELDFLAFSHAQTWAANIRRWSMYLRTSDEKNPRLAQFKVQLDRLQPSEFIWEPYMVHVVGAVAHPGIFEQRHVQLWTAFVPLIYFGTIEWHPADRVVPQFGGVQDIPGHPVNIDFLHSKVTDGSPIRTRHGMVCGMPERSVCWPFIGLTTQEHQSCTFIGGFWQERNSGEASQRVPTAHEPLLRVNDVPDNRRPE
ncbi:hypothetical protein PIB30_017816 [Stylosanthes scabra]|uniref:Aminotransferase-like plant mobile domain-containing protein n=1 Tax=Stylosanthes scabra TaxID=79078 RepID=A0ABU6V9C3_9FABA|nr:hypothetical protein [Stylosanthes scabra]